MDNIFIKDIILFVKRNIKKIILVSALVSIIYVGFQLLMSNRLPRNNEQDLVVVEDGDTQPAFAEFYIENQDGTVFTNTSLIIEYFLLPDNVEGLENETGIELTELIEADTLSVEEEFITLYRNAGSNKFSFFVQIGNEAENLSVLNYYYNQLTEDEIHFLEERNFYPLITPKLIEEEEDEISVDNRESVSLRNQLINAVIGFLIGLAGSTMLLLIYEILNNKMRYTFSYNRNEEDLFMVFNNKSTDVSELENLVFHPINARKLIVSQHGSKQVDKLIQDKRNHVQNNLESELKVTTDISSISPSLDFDELIFVIDDNATNQKWYKKQRKIANNYNARIKLIHFLIE